jgi:hypothetical protein
LAAIVGATGGCGRSRLAPARSISGRQTRRNLRDDLLSLLVKNEILAWHGGAQLLKPIFGVRKF